MSTMYNTCMIIPNPRLKYRPQRKDERAEMKKVITMDMLSEEDMEDMSDEDVVVDEGIDMAIVVADVVVIPDMSILACNFLVSGM
ncbi:Hypothetical protein PENO1_023070 [Penicillium occitanis (nom. inval.)]|nr:hypothetical protein PENOC_040440 [Penicillium occitanis (nom. inval.)]PCH05312.1 Hypothetical protein PENO1_023070 [Penicillium occitanis (nom. inval.)]